MTRSKPTSKNASTDSSQPHIDPTEFPKVTFEGNLWKIAKGIAKLRELVYEEIDGGTLYGSQSSYEAHLKGSMGELAVAQFLEDLHIEDVTALHPYGDPGWDLSLNGGTIDVKCTGSSYPLPDLIVPAEPEPRADIYVLTHRISRQSVRLVGLATQEQVLMQPARREPGEELNHIVPPEDLLFFRSQE